MFLCDYAEEVNGKLYIMGGGWSRVLTPDQPFNVALAIKVSVPWNEANRQHTVVLHLLTEKFEQVKVGDHDVQLPYNLEVGRPPGVRPGSYLDAPLAANFQGLVLPGGSYLWELVINGQVRKRTPFDVIQPR